MEDSKPPAAAAAAAAAAENDAKDSTNGNAKDSSSSPSKLQRIARKILFLPYFVGIIWTLLHPVVSVITGELKCRGWYLDEHSIEIKFAELSSWEIPSHLKVSLPAQPRGNSKLCDGVGWRVRNKSNLLCHVHGDHFSMAMVTPLANALDPLDEAIVFVVPSPPPSNDWSTSTFHHTLLVSLERMADPVETPWLAKTLIVVAPNGNSTLQDVVPAFLDAYLGSPASTDQSSSVPPLPPKYSSALLRSLVVLDIDDQSEKGVVARGQIPRDRLGKTEFAILPQGRRGVLPNMDLVFLMGQLFTKAMYLSPHNYPQSSFVAHAHAKESRQVAEFLLKQQLVGPLDPTTKKWAQELADMGLFAYSMAMGPYPAHAFALDRGIDSITIQAKFQGMYYRDPAVETIQYWEHLVRALSNLHERLHHSYTLYLLPTPQTFVSHMEYFLPNVLLLLPLAVRGFGIVLWELDRLDLTAVGLAILLTTMSTCLASVGFQNFQQHVSMANAWWVCLYVAIAVVWKTSVLSSTRASNDTVTLQTRRARTLQSLQFIACVTAAYILVPIAFAHTSLSYIPSLLWTPLLAFPNYSTLSKVGKLGCVVLFMVTAPPILLVPRILDSYTAFVRYAYIPLHIQMLLLVLTSVL